LPGPGSVRLAKPFLPSSLVRVISALFQNAVSNLDGS
jgi:hypothetical protein